MDLKFDKDGNYIPSWKDYTRPSYVPSYVPHHCEAWDNDNQKLCGQTPIRFAQTPSKGFVSAQHNSSRPPIKWICEFHERRLKYVLPRSEGVRSLEEIFGD